MIHSSQRILTASNNKPIQLANIRCQFQGKLQGLCDTLNSDWARLKVEGLPEKQYNQFIQNTHSLAESTANFSFPELSRVLKETVRLLNSLKSVEEVQTTLAIDVNLAHIVDESLCIAQRETLEDNVFSFSPAIDSNEKSTPDSHTDTTVFLLEDNTSQPDLTASQLELLGYVCQRYTSLQDLRVAVLGNPPHLIVCDIVFSGGGTAGIEEIRTLKRAYGKNIPVLFVSEKPSTQTRLSALRSGGNGYISKPINMQSLIAKIDPLLKIEEQKPISVLLLCDSNEDDDSNSEVSALKSILDKINITLHTISDPMILIEEALEIKPDLFFIDYKQKDTDGIELTEMLRQDETFMSSPVFFLTSDKNKALHHRATLAGASEIFLTPINEDELIDSATVYCKSSRNRKIHQAYYEMLDPITGLHTEHFFTGELDAACQKITDEKADCNKSKQYLIEIEIANFQAIFPALTDRQCALIAAQFASRIKKSLSEDDISASFHLHTFYILKSSLSTTDINSYITSLSKILNGDAYNLTGKSVRLIACLAATPLNSSSRKTMHAVDARCKQLVEFDPNGHAVLEKKEAPTEEQVNKYWLKQLCTAIEKQRLLLNYQPIVNMLEDGTHRYEVLVRFRDAKDKIVTPTKFYRSAQHYEVDKYIDRWVVENCINYIRQLDESSHIFFVKLSKNSILSATFCDWLEKKLQSIDFPSNQLVFQISETDIGDDLDKFSDLVLKLKELNHKVTLEHYGKNGALLDLLDNVSFDYVKFDKSITHNISNSSKKQESLSHLCKGLLKRDMRMMASYVDSSESLNYLSTHGVNLIQGNLLQTPMNQTNNVEVVMGELSLPYTH